ncbi:N,N'-diacetylchitobiose phosphorylase [Treponema sp.]|uniref:GH36-type glycosyl hydrolase domain-containing protein n=1 Tax=Treponema sp. TaxID=166 RepID=UPI0025CD5CC4|nr:N,N'-diacetylchitobiose phosphorylase [Treponema sp.]MCR5217097.1 N,N'-diacetylchitobiose phosphorylase [Treponema sp.]
MQYGFFDDENKEYVITKPDTPAPWANYLGSPEYGAIISNNAGGYSFVKSGANGRILRYIFNGSDTPGRYIYIRDNESKDYWSTSWQPVGKNLNEYKNECRHGTGYTTFKSFYSGIQAKAAYYVPLDSTHEVWALTIKNCSNKKRSLTVTGYAEFTNNSNYEQDQVNLQYSLFISRTLFENNKVIQQIHGNLSDIEKSRPVDNKIETERFFGLAGAKVSSWCGDKESFLGKYRSYNNPAGVENGDLHNISSYNENSCGALSTDIELKPEETKTIAFIVGMKYAKEADKIIEGYKNTQLTVESQLNELKEWWHSKFNNLKVNTPDKVFNSMVNIWNPYNCFMTFIWSRAASFVYCGLRNGYGYRDTVQDIQGIIHLSPQMAKEKISFMLSAQVDNGAGLPLVKFTHKAGHENTPDDPSYVKETGHPAYRADDALWLFPTVYKYITEIGDIKFLDEVIPFANRDQASVYEHLKRAINFSEEHLGPHDLPAGLYADWNDCLRLGAEGESTFVAMQFYYAMTVMKIFAKIKDDYEYLLYLEKAQEALKKRINDLCWDKDRFIRGFTEKGEVIGKRNDKEASMWLNPQSWAVISGLADESQANKAMKNVEKLLNTEYGAMLMNPPYHSHAFDGALAVIYNCGTKENAGIFSQTQGWLILAESLRGKGNSAWRYFMENAPAAWNDKAEIRKMEPFCYGQFTEGKDSPHFGRSHVHWLTGTASTVMTACVEGILGIRPVIDGIIIQPAVPSEWKSFTVEKSFRGKRLFISVENPEGNESGISEFYVNGEKYYDNFIPEEKLTDKTEVKIIM